MNQKTKYMTAVAVLAMASTAFAATILVTSFSQNNVVSESLSLDSITESDPAITVTGSVVDIASFPNEDHVFTANVENSGTAENRGQLTSSETANPDAVTYTVEYSVDGGTVWTSGPSVNQLIAGSTIEDYMVRVHTASDSTIGTFSLNFDVERTAV